MKTVPAAVLTLWMPALFLIGLCLFLRGMPLQYWSICIPAFPFLLYLNTLAEIHDENGRIRIRRWWGSIYVPQNEVLELSPSSLDGIGRLRLRRFVPPWGIIYFVGDWSRIDVPQASIRAHVAGQSVNSAKRIPDLIASALLGVSGFIVGRVLRGDLNFIPHGSSAKIAGLSISLCLAVLYALARKRSPTTANIALFSAVLIVALVEPG